MSLKSFLELYRAHEGYVCDKWEQYLAAYDAEIGQLVARGEPLNLLEIGVQNGGSLEIWAKLLPAGSRITGIDIDPSCTGLTLPDNVRVVIGDASDAEFLDASLGDQAFDIVIDDGSHRSRDVIHSFRALFPRLLPSGKYFIEDLHASYWSEFGGSFRGQDSAVEFLKSLVDALHVDYFKDTPNVTAEERVALTALNRQIARLCFFDSLAVIEKYPREKTEPFVRTVAGSAVEASTMEWRNYLTSWSTPLMVFDDHVRQVLDAETKQEVARLRDEVARLAGEAAHFSSEAARLGGEAARYQAQLAEAEAASGKLREQLATTEHALARTSGEVRDVEAKLHERERELQLVEGALKVEHRRGERLRRELTELRDKRNALRARLKAIKASWSWRLSLPIRTIERLLK